MTHVQPQHQRQLPSAPLRSKAEAGVRLLLAAAGDRSVRIASADQFCAKPGNPTSLALTARVSAQPGRGEPVQVSFRRDFRKLASPGQAALRPSQSRRAPPVAGMLFHGGQPGQCSRVRAKAYSIPVKTLTL